MKGSPSFTKESLRTTKLPEIDAATDKTEDTAINRHTHITSVHASEGRESYDT
jgi:hypothetical protein